MSESLKGFYTILLRDPPRIKVSWEPITRADFESVEVAWWCLGAHEAENVYRWLDSSQYLIDVKPSETYVVAARAHFTGHYSTKWASVVVEVPRIDDQYADLGQATVIDTPRGPAILLDELWEACGQ